MKSIKWVAVYSVDMAQNTAAEVDESVWTEPFVPNDEIGSRTGEECRRCKSCGLTTLVGTTDDVVHKTGCPHRGN